jgi:hypothetical protein
MFRRPLNAYRSTGADPPLTDRAGAHGTAMEGYYWRVDDADAGSVIVALCGVRRGPNGPRAAVALAAHPSGFARHAVVAPAAAEPRSFGARAASVLRGSGDGSSIRLGEDAWVELRLRSTLLRRDRVADGEASSEAYACVWTAPRRTWRRTGAPALRGTGDGATPTPSPNGRGTWIAREGGPASGRDGPTRDVSADARPRSRPSSARLPGCRSPSQTTSARGPSASSFSSPP